MGIRIPALFNLYNTSLRYGFAEEQKRRYKILLKRSGKASDCIRCGACEAACPQHLPIRDLLEEIAGVLE